jgi:hypothetical protein
MAAQVRAGLEEPEAGGYQKRVGHMRLLGELYNYRLVDSKCARCFLALHASGSPLLLPHLLEQVQVSTGGRARMASWGNMLPVHPMSSHVCGPQQQGMLACVPWIPRS